MGARNRTNGDAVPYLVRRPIVRIPMTLVRVVTAKKITIFTFLLAAISMSFAAMLRLAGSAKLPPTPALEFSSAPPDAVLSKSFCCCFRIDSLMACTRDLPHTKKVTITEEPRTMIPIAIHRRPVSVLSLRSKTTAQTGAIDTKVYVTECPIGLSSHVDIAKTSGLLRSKSGSFLDKHE